MDVLVEEGVDLQSTDPNKQINALVRILQLLTRGDQRILINVLTLSKVWSIPLFLNLFPYFILVYLAERQPSCQVVNISNSSASNNNRRKMVGKNLNILN